MQISQKTMASANNVSTPENVVVSRRLDELELACRYSVVYELTRIDYVLKTATNFLSVEPSDLWLTSISA